MANITVSSDINTLLQSADYAAALTNLGVGAADITATGSTEARSINDRFADTVNVKDFGAVGDGVTDDTAAIQAAIAAAIADGGGVVQLGRATYLVGSAGLTIASDKVHLRGVHMNATILLHAGGTAPTIDVSAANQCRLSDFKCVWSSGTQTAAVRFAYAAAVTSFKHGAQGVWAEGFPNIGFDLNNIEHFDGRQLVALNCGTNGFKIHNAAHTGGSLGISNNFDQCRAQGSGSAGWDVNSIESSTFARCQSLSSLGGIQFKLGGASGYVTIRHLDVEYNGTSVGLQASGVGHDLEITGYNLATGIQSAGLTTSTIRPCKVTSVTTPVLLNGADADLVVWEVGYTVAGAGTRVLRMGPTRIADNELAQIMGAAGSVAVPVFTRLADTNTGVYFPADDQLGFSIGGNQAGKFQEAADGETALLLRRNVGGAFTAVRVSMGVTDSGGTGFKVLRVPNT
jgi:hypothetical protein